MDTSKNTCDLTAKINFSMPLPDESSLNPNNVGFSELDITETTQSEGTQNDTISVNGTKEDNLNVSMHDNSSNSITFFNNDDTDITVDLPKSPKGEETVATNTKDTEKPIEEQTDTNDVIEEADVSAMQVDEELDDIARRECDLFQHSFVELGRRLWESNSKVQQYTKGCLWSPDGTCLLIPVHLNGMHVVELPTDLYEIESIPLDRKVSELNSAVHVKEGGTVYDYVWYPHMNSTVPETCCWLASRQHEPIHMWDAFNGELRCSYRGYDDVDEVEAAISVTFSNDGDKIYAGYKKSIKVFNTNVPGRDCNSIPIKQAISCFALNDSNDDTITSGTWNGYINHYDLRVPKLGSLFTLSGHSGGITWLQYAPEGQDNWYLFSGARKDNKILQWDMRNYSEPVNTFIRNVDTNQRIYFDLSPQCEWLVSGDTKGLLHIWDLYSENENIELQLHQDCCNGVSFHPTLPILATTSGQYHFADVTEDDEDASKVDNAKEEKIVEYENALLLLWYDKSHEANNGTIEPEK